MPDDADIAKKIEQAEFNLGKLREPESEIAAESHFAGFLAAVRSATMYVSELAHWPAINAWERALPPEDYDRWRAVIRLRNDDIHNGAVLPELRWTLDKHWGPHFPAGYFGGMFGAQRVHMVEHPDGRRFEAIPLAEAALRLVKQLAAEYKTL